MVHYGLLERIPEKRTGTIHKEDYSSLPDVVETTKKSKSELSKMIKNRREKMYEEKIPCDKNLMTPFL
jgi:hypothetical protein